MDQLYAHLRKRARRIAAKYPIPDFYFDFPREIALSRQFFESCPVILRLRAHVAAALDNDFGHGLDHVTKVTLDAGALSCIEGALLGMDEKTLGRALLCAQCAGLLHDLERKRKDHARCGAEKARGILADYPLEEDEISDICRAIANHEAFREPEPSPAGRGAMLSDSLYDADKFRWGPDNFTETVWQMISFLHAPLSLFVKRYPEGVKGVARIKKTFRSMTGKAYGPQFIDIGLAMGQEIYDMILADYSL